MWNDQQRYRPHPRTNQPLPRTDDTERRTRLRRLSILRSRSPKSRLSITTIFGGIVIRTTTPPIRLRHHTNTNNGVHCYFIPRSVRQHRVPPRRVRMTRIRRRRLLLRIRVTVLLLLLLLLTTEQRPRQQQEEPAGKSTETNTNGNTNRNRNAKGTLERITTQVHGRRGVPASIRAPGLASSF